MMDGPGRAARPRVTLALCFLAALAEGYDLQSAGLAAPRMAPALHLTRAELGPVFSASVVGLLIGAVVFGALADRVGRKGVLALSLAVFGLFTAVTVLAGGFHNLLWIRLAAGLGLGGAMPNLIALSAEAVRQDRRARLVTIVTAGMPFGGAVAGLVAAALGWREIFYVGAAAPLVLAPLIGLAVPESAGYLAARQAADAAQRRAHGGFAWILFGDGRALTTLLLWCASFCGLLCLYVLVNWLPTLMGDKGVGRAQASLISVLFNLGGGAGVIILAMLLEGRRRAWTVGLWYAGVAASVAALAATGPQLAQAGAAGFAAGLFVCSAPIPLYGWAPGYYALVIRGTGVGASVAVGRLGAIAGPLLAAGLLAAGAGASGVLFGLLPLAALAGAATLGLLRRPAVAD